MTNYCKSTYCRTIAKKGSPYCPKHSKSHEELLHEKKITRSLIRKFNNIEDLAKIIDYDLCDYSVDYCIKSNVCAKTYIALLNILNHKIRDDTELGYINKGKSKNATMLKRAARDGDIESVKIFVENGVNVNYKSNAPLRFALGNGHMEIVSYLIENGANLNNIDHYTCYYAYCNGKKSYEFISDIGFDIKVSLGYIINTNLIDNILLDQNGFKIVFNNFPELFSDKMEYICKFICNNGLYKSVDTILQYNKEYLRLFYVLSILDMLYTYVHHKGLKWESLKKQYKKYNIKAGGSYASRWNGHQKQKSYMKKYKKYTNTMVALLKYTKYDTDEVIMKRCLYKNKYFAYAIYEKRNYCKEFYNKLDYHVQEYILQNMSFKKIKRVG